MKQLLVGVYVLVLVAGVFSNDDLQIAEPCDVESCQLPDCRCSSTNIPGGLAPSDTPQLVMVTFDDAINVLNVETYRRVLYNRRNWNGCSAGATFYVSHQYTNYQLANELYRNGFEIALHSITHQTPQTYWRDATYDVMMAEFSDQRRQMAHFANIPIDDIKGMRIPFLQMTGNSSFQMMADAGLLYDSSWGTFNALSPGLWPYTLDYASIQECMIPPCPNASIPGTWVVPMLSFIDLEGIQCGMVDACSNTPAFTDEEGWLQFIITNFERQYLGNRAPFGFFVHEWFISINPAIERALIRFLDMINSLPDVYMVNANEVVEYVRNPVPIPEYRSQPCRNVPQPICQATSCGPLTSSHNNADYWLAICGSCPATYPWIGNPLGLVE